MPTEKKKRAKLARAIRQATGLSYVDAHRAARYLKREYREDAPAYVRYRYVAYSCECCAGYGESRAYVVGPKGQYP